MNKSPAAELLYRVVVVLGALIGLVAVLAATEVGFSMAARALVALWDFCLRSPEASDPTVAVKGAMGFGMVITGMAYFVAVGAKLASAWDKS